MVANLSNEAFGGGGGSSGSRRCLCGSLGLVIADLSYQSFSGCGWSCWGRCLSWGLRLMVADLSD
jgi:hypothetical protein